MFVTFFVAFLTSVKISEIVLKLAERINSTKVLPNPQKKQGWTDTFQGIKNAVTEVFFSAKQKPHEIFNAAVQSLPVHVYEISGISSTCIASFQEALTALTKATIEEKLESLKIMLPIFYPLLQKLGTNLYPFVVWISISMEK